MSDYALLSEACKIAQALDGVQNLSAVGIGNYLRKCSPEVVLGLIEANAKLENEVQRITEARRLEWSNAQQVEAENKDLIEALASAREFIMADSKTRQMLDETGEVSPLFPRRKGVLARIDAALAEPRP